MHGRLFHENTTEEFGWTSWCHPQQLCEYRNSAFTSCPDPYGLSQEELRQIWRSFVFYIFSSWNISARGVSITELTLEDVFDPGIPVYIAPCVLWQHGALQDSSICTISTSSTIIPKACEIPRYMDCIKETTTTNSYSASVEKHLYICICILVYIIKIIFSNAAMCLRTIDLWLQYMKLFLL